MELIRPLWPAPGNIIAGTTTRTGGVSASPFDSFNLAQHVDDVASNVDSNRAALDEELHRVAPLPTESLQWHWLSQTHSTRCIRAGNSLPASIPEADAAWTTCTNVVCTVLTADCLPVLIADRNGRAVAAIHAGWRGLCNGVIQQCVQQICVENETLNPPIEPAMLLAWLGPAIGPARFEVGEDVRHAFEATSFAGAGKPGLIERCFVRQANRNGPRYLCDLYQLATLALNQCGVNQVYGGGYCTHRQQQQFFSYRRDGQTGRMATFIAILPQ